MKVQIGEEWEVYSTTAKRWAVAVVKQVDPTGVVTLRYKEFPEHCVTDEEIMLTSHDLLRRHARSN